MRPNLLTPICLALLLPVCAAADDEISVELDPMVVVASKIARPLSSIAGQVTVIDASEIEANLVEDLDELVRYEPGVDSETSGTRFGMGGFNIRGIGGNRVALLVDGVPVRRGFAVGSYSNAGRALLDSDRIKRLEILHGPASSLYGSDAIGGVMSFTTWDPADLLSRSGGNYLGLRGGYRSSNDSWVGSALGAVGSDPHGLLFSATLREGHEKESNAVSATELDPQDWDSSSYSARYTFNTSSDNLLRLSAEQFKQDTATNVISVLGQGRFRSTTELLGDDRDETTQMLADYTFSTDRIDQGVVRVFRTDSETRQLTLEERAKSTVPTRYRRYFQYETELTGAQLDLFTTLETDTTTHLLGTGVSYLHTWVSELRDGYQQNMQTGEISHEVLGEQMPVRDFPNSTTEEWGVYLQDEISLAGGRWEVIPALRYDNYSLDPEADPIYLEDYPDTPLVSVDDSRFSPRLAALVHLGEEWNLYGQYSQGFRAPPVEDVNIGFDISLFRFKAIPNPDLQSETSSGYELGIRRFSAAQRFSLTWFDTSYDDFIESRVLIGVDPDSGYLLFQSRNINQARIYGIDLRFDQDLGAWTESLKNWTLRAAGYWSRGRNEDNNQPLNSVSPPQAVIGLQWRSENGDWETAVNGTFTARQDEIDETARDRFATPSYAILDLTAGWRINRRLSLRGGVFNLTDETYWRWSDVSELPVNDPMIPLLSQPGRNFTLTARFEF
jgi:hemoglobin/transferrin/lactoferrin receptor protein